EFGPLAIGQELGGSEPRLLAAGRFVPAPELVIALRRHGQGAAVDAVKFVPINKTDRVSFALFMPPAQGAAIRYRSLHRAQSVEPVDAELGQLLWDLAFGVDQNQLCRKFTR